MPRPLLLLLAALSLVACPVVVEPLDDDDDASDDDDGAGDDDDAASTDPLRFFDETSESELLATIEDLEDFGTRWTFSDGDTEARDYLVDRLADYGFVAELDAFTVSGEPCHNVIARKQGVVDPDVVWIYSAHYDSTSDQPDVYAPGADDNASGVAGVLEAARLLSEHDFRDSIWFVLTAAEEQGSLGSEHLVQWLDDEPVEVRGVIAPDMIGYWPLGDSDLMDILGDPASEHLVEDMADVADALGVAHKDWIDHSYCYGDDHTNYQEYGMPAITPMDCVEAHNIAGSGEHTPHYHQVTDTSATLHLGFTAKVAGVITATLAGWAGEQP